jgi:hypothetical protein
MVNPNAIKKAPASAMPAGGNINHAPIEMSADPVICSAAAIAAPKE